MIKLLLCFIIYILICVIVNLLRQETLSATIQRRAEAGNFPTSYLDNDNKSKISKLKCGRYPKLGDLQFSNSYWQTYKDTPWIYYLYGAYLDVRENEDFGNQNVIIIFMMTKKVKPSKPYCQIWFNDTKEPVISKVEYINKVSRGGSTIKYTKPFFFACPLPLYYSKKVPTSVSLVKSNCSLATNNLKVNYNVPSESEPKNSFGVCMKAITMVEDESAQLIEWIEILKVLGASKIFFYLLDVHSNILKVNIIILMFFIYKFIHQRFCITMKVKD